MSLLLSKIILLLLLAALFGALFGWWLARRRWQDVTVEYSRWQTEWADWRRGFEARLAERPQPDLAPVLAGINAVETTVDAAVRGIKMPTPPVTDLQPVLDAVGRIRLPEPVAVDLEPMGLQLANLAASVAAIRIPEPKEPMAPKEISLEPLHERLQQLEASVRGIHIPEPVPAKEVDFSGVMARLSALDERVSAIHIPPASPPPDLAPAVQPVLDRVQQLEQAVLGIEIPLPKEVDLGEVLQSIAALQQRIDNIRMPEPAAPVDLRPLVQPVIDRVEQLEKAVLSIEIPLPKDPPPPKEVDLSGVMARFAALESSIGSSLAAIKIPAPKEPDFSPMLAGLADMQERIAAIRMPDIPKFPELPAPAQPTDIRPLQDKLEQLEHAIKAIVIPPPAPAPPPPPKEVDLSGVLSRLHELDRRVASIRIPEPLVPPPAPPATDLAPLQSQVNALRRAVEAIHIPAATAIDLEPLLQRLGAMEEKLDRPTPAPVIIQPPAPAPAARVRSGSRNLLVAPDFGKPDDLKRIKGVAEVLEKMLHGIGVYYFWQVAEWSAADVAYVDTQLTAFKGRIARDDWTSQAQRFAAEPGAARRPGEL